MKNPNDFKRISFGMSEWEWAMVSDALDAYLLEHMDYADLSEITAYAEHIDETIGIKNFDPEGRWNKKSK